MVEDRTAAKLLIQAPETCQCISEVEALPAMKESNTVVLVNLFGPVRTFVSTWTEKKVRGKKPPLLAATFCPFCGVRYPNPAKVEKASADG